MATQTADMSSPHDELKVIQEYNPKLTFFGALVHKTDLAPVDEKIPKIQKQGEKEHSNDDKNNTNKIYSFCGVYLTYSRLHSQIVVHYKDGRFAEILKCHDQKYQNFNPDGVFHVFENNLYVYNPKETQIHVYGMNSDERLTDFQNTLIKLDLLQTFPIWRPAINISANKNRIVVIEQDNALRVYSKEGNLLAEDDKSSWLKQYNRESNSSLAISSLNFVILQIPDSLVIYHPNGKLFKKKPIQKNAVSQVLVTRSDKLCVLSVNNDMRLRLSFYHINTLELDHQLDITSVNSTFIPSAMCYWDLDDAYALVEKNKIQIYK